VQGLKDICLLSEYFGDAPFAALNHKNSTPAHLGWASGLRQLLIFYPPEIFGGPQRAPFSQNTRMSLAKTFQPLQFEF
jgi:hypothetical protein